MKRLMNRQTSMEAKLMDHEGWARLRIHGIPEKEEGNDIWAFLEKLLRHTGLTTNTKIKIERALWSRAAEPADSKAKHQSIILKLQKKWFAVLGR